jgi:hypothetical protein
LHLWQKAYPHDASGSIIAETWTDYGKAADKAGIDLDRQGEPVEAGAEDSAGTDPSWCDMHMITIACGWANTGQYIITNAGGFAALAGVALACYGLRTWKREYLFKRNSELLEDALLLFYQADHAIAFMRNGFTFAKELEDFEFPSDRAEVYSKELYKTTFVIRKRFDEKQEIFDKLYAIELRFRARFRREPTAEFGSMKEIVRDLLLAADAYAQDGLNKDIRQEVQRVIWKPYDPKDAFGCRVAKVISDFETRFDSLMRRRAW